MSDIASILTVIFCTTGAILGALTYFRDRPKVVVTLQWDMAVTDNQVYDSHKLWGVLCVTNVGRRPIYTSAAALDFGKSCDHIEILRESIRGVKLGEGDPPATFIASQEGLEKYAMHWKKARAMVQDSAGKTYYSKKVDTRKVPSWVQKARKT
jgi:hypothetical protein